VFLAYPHGAGPNANACQALKTLLVGPFGLSTCAASTRVVRHCWNS